jgi:hypothetical protein
MANNKRDKTIHAFMGYLDTLHDFCGARANIISESIVIKYARIGLRSQLENIWGTNPGNADVSAQNIRTKLGLTDNDVDLNQMQTLLDHHQYKYPSFEQNILDFTERYIKKTQGSIDVQSIDIVRNKADPQYDNKIINSIATMFPVQGLVIDTSHVPQDTLCKVNNSRIKVHTTSASFMDSDGNTVSIDQRCGINDTTDLEPYGLTKTDGETMSYKSMMFSGTNLIITTDDGPTRTIETKKLPKNSYNVGAYAQVIESIHNNKSFEPRVDSFLKFILADTSTNNNVGSILKIFDIKRSGDWSQIRSINAINTKYAQDKVEFTVGFVTLDIPAAARGAEQKQLVMKTGKLENGNKLRLTFYGKVEMTPEMKQEKINQLKIIQKNLGSLLQASTPEQYAKQYTQAIDNLSQAYDSFISGKVIERTLFGDVFIADLNSYTVQTVKLSLSGITNTVYIEALSFISFIKSWLSKFDINKFMRDAQTLHDQLVGSISSNTDETILKAAFSTYNELLNNYNIFSEDMFTMLDKNTLLQDLDNVTNLLNALADDNNRINPYSTNTIIFKDMMLQYSAYYVTRTFCNILDKFQSLGDIIPPPTINSRNPPSLKVNTLEKYNKYSSFAKKSQSNTLFYTKYVTDNAGVVWKNISDIVNKANVAKEKLNKTTSSSSVSSFAVDKALTKMYEKYLLINEKYILKKNAIPKGTSTAFINRYNNIQSIYGPTIEKLSKTKEVYYREPGNKSFKKQQRGNVFEECKAFKATLEFKMPLIQSTKKEKKPKLVAKVQNNTKITTSNKTHKTLKPPVKQHKLIKTIAAEKIVKKRIEAKRKTYENEDRLRAISKERAKAIARPRPLKRRKSESSDRQKKRIKKTTFVDLIKDVFDPGAFFNSLNGFYKIQKSITGRPFVGGGEGNIYYDTFNKLFNLSIINNDLLLPQILGNLSGICMHTYPTRDERDEPEEDDKDKSLNVYRSSRSPSTIPYVRDLPIPVLFYNDDNISIVKVHKQYVPPPELDPAIHKCIISKPDTQGYVDLDAFKYITFSFFDSGNYDFVDRKVSSLLRKPAPERKKSKSDSPDTVLQERKSLSTLQSTASFKGGSTAFFNADKLTQYLHNLSLK